MDATPFNSPRSSPMCRSTTPSSFRPRGLRPAANEFGSPTSRLRRFSTGPESSMIGGMAGSERLARNGVLLAGAGLAIAGSLCGQSSTYRASRAEGGKPDLNGVWQVLNEANYDLEGHSARPAMALRPGPYGPAPAAAVLALGAVG